jgi:hypothetical protein
VSQLKAPGAGLAVSDPGATGYPHLGEIRLWRASTPAGARALAALHG